MAYFNPTIRTLTLSGGGGGGGAQGFQGAQGVAGATGSAGAQGSQGNQGAQGLAAPFASTPTLVTASLSTGTTQPISITDALMAGLSAGGRAGPGTAGTLGVIAASFASSGAETGTGSNQGGLGSAASSTQPYNATDFPGGHFECQLVKSNGDPPALLDMLSTANISFPLSIAAPVYCYGSLRSDLGADLKWRFFFYFRNQVTGVETPFTPNAPLSNVSLYVPQVFAGGSLPTAAGLGIPLAAQGAAEVEFGVTADLVALGTAAAGATGKVMDAGSSLQMPRLDQVLAPTAAVAGNAQEATGWADPTAITSLSTRKYSDSGVYAVRYLQQTALPAYTYSNGAGTITINANGAAPASDGITPALNDEFIFDIGVNGFENGIYKWTTIGTGGTQAVATRSISFDSQAKIIANTLVKVREGFSSGGRVYVYSGPQSITLGTTGLAWSALEPGPNDGIFIADDFEWSVVAPLANALSPRSGLFLNMGGAATIVASTATSIGILDIGTGASATGVAAWQNATTTPPYFFDTSNYLISDDRVGIPTLDDGVQTFAYVSGWADNNIWTSITKGIYFEYRLAGTGTTFWTCVTNNGNGGSRTQTTTSITVTAGQLYHLVAVMRPYSNQVDFWIDGVLVATHTTNLPANGTALTVVVGMTKALGTITRTCRYDWIRKRWWVTKRRAA